MLQGVPSVSSIRSRRDDRLFVRAATCVAVVAACSVIAGLPMAQPAGGVRWVWSGGVTARSAVVKARVHRAGIPVRLVVIRGGDPAAMPQVHDMRADDSGIAGFELEGLEPATRYRYRADVDGGAALTGTFRTFGDGPWSFRLAFASCAETGSASSVFDAIRTTQPDLFIHMGDFHYEDIAAADVGRFRRAFDAVMASPTQSRLYRSVPIAYMWDDHDYGGNNSDGSSASRPAVLAVYRQFVPHYPLNGDGLTGIHQAFTIGRVRVIMTDERSQRTSSRAGLRTRSMLGASQLQWLKAQLSAASSAPLVVWVNTVPWIAKAGSFSDNWGSYAAEREDIANHINRLGLTRRIVMLSGDAHMVAIDDGTHSYYATGTGRTGPGFVVMHAAPLDQSTSEKGGPYSHGPSRQRGQFGLLQLADDGRALKVELSGRDKAGAPIPGMRLALTCASRGCEAAR
jgi:phosphodiesterase/alkaline phosphatase D-like protein